jgi:hypothetical protein
MNRPVATAALLVAIVLLIVIIPQCAGRQPTAAEQG